MERECFILSTAHTQCGDPYITLLAANDSGYRCRCHTAGRYSESHVLPTPEIKSVIHKIGFRCNCRYCQERHWNELLEAAQEVKSA